jgi:hypothetical protein
MVIDNAKRLEREIKQLEHRHEKLARQYNHAFENDLPSEKALRQELVANASKIFSNGSELTELKWSANGSQPEGATAATKGSTLWTWTISRH